jgi:predicted AAA+ superfamily ATPase
MLLYRVNYYNIKTKSILKTTGKYYAGDIGVLNSVIGYKDNSFGNKLENIVFLNLLSLGYEVYTAELYQKNKDNKEIDFVVFKDNGFKYIQVTHTLTEQNKKREVGNLLSIKDGFDKIILLISDETKYKVDGIKRINIVR